MSRVTALAGRRPGTPGRRPPHNPAGVIRPAKRQTLDLAGIMWQQGTTMNRALSALYRQEAA